LAVLSSGNLERESSDVHEWISVELSRGRNADVMAEAEQRRLARLAPRRAAWPVLRARVARRVFSFALALEREETWKAVWEKLEAPRHP
jgi:hypothetical protein